MPLQPFSRVISVASDPRQNDIGPTFTGAQQPAANAKFINKKAVTVRDGIGIAASLRRAQVDTNPQYAAPGGCRAVESLTRLQFVPGALRNITESTAAPIVFSESDCDNFYIATGYTVMALYENIGWTLNAYDVSAAAGDVFTWRIFVDPTAPSRYIISVLRNGVTVYSSELLIRDDYRLRRILPLIASGTGMSLSGILDDIELLDLPSTALAIRSVIESHYTVDAPAVLRPPLMSVRVAHGAQGQVVGHFDIPKTQTDRFAGWQDRTVKVGSDIFSISNTSGIIHFDGRRAYAAGAYPFKSNDFFAGTTAGTLTGDFTYLLAHHYYTPAGEVVEGIPTQQTVTLAAGPGGGATISAAGFSDDSFTAGATRGRYRSSYYTVTSQSIAGPNTILNFATPHGFAPLDIIGVVDASDRRVTFFRLGPDATYDTCVLSPTSLSINIAIGTYACVTDGWALAVYRSTANSPSPYYLVGYFFPDTTITDSLSDATLVTAPLYNALQELDAPPGIVVGLEYFQGRLCCLTPSYAVKTTDTNLQVLTNQAYPAKLPIANEDGTFYDYAYNDPTQGAVLAFSSAESAHRWDALNTVSFDTTDAGKPTGLMASNDVLYVFFDRSIWAIKGTLSNEPTFSVQLVARMGCTAANTITRTPRGIMFLNTLGDLCLLVGDTIDNTVGEGISSRLHTATDTFRACKAYYASTEDAFYLAVANTQDNGDYRWTAKGTLFKLDMTVDKWIEFTDVDATGGLAETNSGIYFATRENCAEWHSTDGEATKSTLLHMSPGRIKYDVKEIDVPGFLALAKSPKPIDFAWYSTWELLGELPGLAGTLGAVTLFTDGGNTNWMQPTLSIDTDYIEDSVTHSLTQTIGQNAYGVFAYGASAYGGATMPLMVYPFNIARAYSARIVVTSAVDGYYPVIAGYQVDGARNTVNMKEFK